MATIPSTAVVSPSSPSSNGQTYRGPFSIMTVLFFMWGFMTVFNDILIPRFKEAFTLNYLEAMLVQFAFFGAYFIGALIYFIISVKAGDPIARIGYKNGVVIGLLISASGSALFWQRVIQKRVSMPLRAKRLMLCCWHFLSQFSATMPSPSGWYSVLQLFLSFRSPRTSGTGSAELGEW